MTQELFVNTPHQAVTLNGAIATAPAAGTVETWAVTITAIIGTQFALPTIGTSQMRMQLDTEIILVTAGTTTAGNQSWTVTRGADSTAPTTHATGTPLVAKATAAALGSLGGTFTTAPTSGTPTIPIGTGTFGGGAAPDFQGTAALGINMAAGYSGNLLDLQVAGVSEFAVSAVGAVAMQNATIAGKLGVASLGAVGTAFRRVTPILDTIQITSIAGGSTTAPTFQIQGIALQTGDLFDAEDSTPTNQFGIANIGTGGSPIWALRVAPTANAESMVQSHAGGSSTGKAIQVIDNAGTSLGWLQLLA